MYQLYGGTNSGHSFKVRSFLLLAGIPHAYRWIDLQAPRAARPAAFLAASKFGEVPVLVDGDIARCQSNAILAHLAQRHAQFDGAPGERSAVLEWLAWEANRIGFSVPNLRYALRWSPQPPAVLDYLRQRALADLAVLDQALAAGGFLLPSGPTIADLSCSAYLFWLADIGIDAHGYPNIARWLAALRALPGWTHPDSALPAEPY